MLLFPVVVSLVSGATGEDPDSDTFDGNFDLEEDISATGSYTLTKVKCRALWSTFDRMVSRVYRSINLPEEDINGVIRDSILAKVDQGVRYIRHTQLTYTHCRRLLF